MGATASINAGKRLWRTSPMACASLTILAAYWAIASMVLMLDPYDIYPWGKPTSIDSANLTDDNMLLVAAVAKNPRIDLLMIGSSTAIHYSGDDLRGAFPGSRYPFNLSYYAVRPLDRALTMATVARYSRAKKLIVWLDWSYSLPERTKLPVFPAFMYDETWFSGLRVVNYTSLKVCLRLLRGVPIFPDFQKRLADENADLQAEYAVFQTRKSREQLAALVNRYRPIIDRPGKMACSALPGLMSGLIAPLRTWIRPSRSIDIVIPAYSPAFYYVRGDSGSGLNLADQLTLRRCVFQETASMANVRIIALDADKLLTDDPKNYVDSAHLFGPRALNIALGDIAQGRYLLTSQNIEHYLAELRQRVVNYQVDVQTTGLAVHTGRQGGPP